MTKDNKKFKLNVQQLNHVKKDEIRQIVETNDNRDVKKDEIRHTVKKDEIRHTVKKDEIRQTVETNDVKKETGKRGRPRRVSAAASSSPANKKSKK